MFVIFVSGLFPGTGRFPDIALEITGKCKFIRKFHNAGNFCEGMSPADQYQTTVYHKTVDQLLGRDSRISSEMSGEIFTGKLFQSSQIRNGRLRITIRTQIVDQIDILKQCHGFPEVFQGIMLKYACQHGINQTAGQGCPNGQIPRSLKCAQVPGRYQTVYTYLLEKVVQPKGPGAKFGTITSFSTQEGTARGQWPPQAGLQLC